MPLSITFSSQQHVYELCCKWAWLYEMIFGASSNQESTALMIFQVSQIKSLKHRGSCSPEQALLQSTHSTPQLLHCIHRVVRTDYTQSSSLYTKFKAWYAILAHTKLMLFRSLVSRSSVKSLSTSFGENSILSVFCFQGHIPCLQFPVGMPSNTGFCNSNRTGSNHATLFICKWEH